MWIGGRRRGGAKDLARHLQKTDENEFVKIRELEGFSFDTPTKDNFEKALKQMEAVGYAKADKRNLYHAILAPAHAETLNAAQRDFMVNYYAEHMGFKGYQRAVVEHWKKGKQHFHLVFNIIDPVTGKTDELKWTKTKEWKISRGLEEVLGLSMTPPKGKSIPTWAMQRGKRTDVDPLKAKKDITAIFHASKTTQEFIAALEKAGFSLTRGRRKQLVLVDKVGDTHGLMRMLEGKRLADLRKKFPGIDKILFESHINLVKARKTGKAEEPQAPIEATDIQTIRNDVQKAYRTSKSGAEFYAKLNKRGYAIGRSLKGFTLIDQNGDKHDLHELLGKEAAQELGKKFLDLAAIKPSPLSEIIRRIRKRLPNRSYRHPLRRTGFMFTHVGRGVTSQSSGLFSGQGSMIALILLLFYVARRRTAQERKRRDTLFPFMRPLKRKIFLNTMPKDGPSRAEIEYFELLRFAWEHQRVDILASFGIYMLSENPTLSELIQFGVLPLDALEP